MKPNLLTESILDDYNSSSKQQL